MRRKQFIGLLLMLVMLAIPVTVLAQESVRTVKDGDVVPDDVTSFNQDLVVEAGGLVEGDVTVVNGTAVIDGEIDGDLVIFGGDLTLGTTAVVGGECIVMNGQLTDESSSPCMHLPDFGLSQSFPSTPGFPSGAVETGGQSALGRVFGALLSAISMTLLMGLVAAGTQTVLPTQTGRITQAMQQKPTATTVVGALTTVLMPFVLLVLTVLSTVLILACFIGLLGYPLIMAISLGFVAATLWTWVIWGQMLGNRIGRRFMASRSPLIKAVAGTAVVTFILSFITFSSGIGTLLVIVLTFLPLCWGIGSVVLTRFGTRPFPSLATPSENASITTPPMSDKVMSVLETLPDQENEIRRESSKSDT